MKKAIIIGASSGIGKELAKILSKNNYMLGLVSRREKLLIELQKNMPQKSFVKSFDITSQTSKAFISNYMEGLRIKAKKSKIPISITDIKPGYVNTHILVKENLFWVAEPEKAALQIYKAIDKKKNLAYITKRWTLIAWLLRIVPDFIYKRF